MDKISRGFPIQVQEHLLGVGDHPASISVHLAELRSMIWRPRALQSRDRSATYGILTPVDGYWGITTEQRERD